MGGRAQSQWKVEVVGRVYDAKVRRGASSLGGLVGSAVFPGFFLGTLRLSVGESLWGLCVVSFFHGCPVLFSRLSRVFLKSVVSC